jgi:hypothetical protein
MSKNEIIKPVSQEILDALRILMASDELASFRLVGGTSLSLQFRHRQSIDIDLFTDAEYGTINFKAIDSFLKKNFNYTDFGNNQEESLGRMYFIGESVEKAIKLDLFYTESFIRPSLLINNIRLAGTEDISAMKLEIISGGGRKKDFWDIAELLERYPVSELIGFYSEKYPFFDINKVISGLTDFTFAEEMDDPLCLKNKVWELIKLDIREAVTNYLKNT